MWSSIESLKENLNRIALEIHEDDDDDDPQLSVSSNSGDSVHNSVLSPANRRISRNFSPSKSPAQHNHHSPIANGIDSAHKFEVLSSLYLSVKSELEVKSAVDNSTRLEKVAALYSVVHIEKYKAEINRLKESEAEIKALSVNYAALLKEKEVIINLNYKFS
nr:golgin candidate 4 isoform X1 [Ipomoea batatas]